MKPNRRLNVLTKLSIVGKFTLRLFSFFRPQMLNSCDPALQQLELEKKKWQGQRFSPASEQIHITKDQTVMVCPRAVSGLAQCCYAVCLGCYNGDNSGEQKSGRNKRSKVADRMRIDSPMKKRQEECCHQLQDLKVHNNFFWCEPFRKANDGLFSWTWLQRVKGCAGCNKMFVQLGFKDKRTLDGRKVTTLPEMDPKLVPLWERLDDGKITSDELETELAEAEREVADSVKDRLMFE